MDTVNILCDWLQLFHFNTHLAIGLVNSLLVADLQNINVAYKSEFQQSKCIQ
jgi:hypothetical protein